MLWTIASCRVTYLEQRGDCELVIGPEEHHPLVGLQP